MRTLWNVMLNTTGHVYCSGAQTVEEAIADAKERGYTTIFGVTRVYEPTPEEEANADVTEDAYHKQQSAFADWIRKHDPRMLRNLLLRYFEGTMDVGITEGLTLDQVTGITAYIEDILIFANMDDVDLTDDAE